MKRRNLVLGMGCAAALPLVGARTWAADDAPLDVATAKAIVAGAAARKIPWTGPTTGPKARPGRSVILVSEDQRNGGALGVSVGVTQAAKAIGWNLRIIDGGGTISGRSAAFDQAMTLKPDAIIVDNDDAVEQHINLQRAAASGIKLIGWHATIRPGPAPELNLFTNISTDPLQVARTAAALVVAHSNGAAHVVVFTDSTEKISVLKSDAMARNISSAPGCSVLSTQDTPLAQVSARIPQLTTSLLQQYGSKWNYSLAINDGFFDFMGPSLRSAGITRTGFPLNIAGGDGSRAAFQRIRTRNYQLATVAEPLSLHGWQAIDEANRAIAGAPPSGFVAPIHLVTAANVAADGGADDVFDPDNGYRAIYRRIWGVA